MHATVNKNGHRAKKTAPIPPCTHAQAVMDAVAAIGVAAWGERELAEVPFLLEAQLTEVGPK